MPANECIPVFEPSDRVTARCTAAVRGKRFVAISADIPGGLYGTDNIRVAEAGAGVKAIGVAAYDGAINEEIPVITDHSIVPMPAGAAITAGQEVQSDAAGRPTPVTTGVKVGIAVSTQSTVDADVGIKLYS